MKTHWDTGCADLESADALLAEYKDLVDLLADLLTHPMGLHPLAKPRVEAMLRKARGE